MKFFMIYPVRWWPSNGWPT